MAYVEFGSRVQFVSSEGRARAASRRAWPPSPRWPSSAAGSAAPAEPDSGSRRGRFPECGGGAPPAATAGAAGAAGVSAGAGAGGAPAVAEMFAVAGILDLFW